MYKVLFIVSSADSVNCFIVHQIKELSKRGMEVYLICGKGELDQRTFDSAKEVIFSNFFKRDISIVNDILNFIFITHKMLSIRPMLAIYSTPKAALLSSIISKFLGVRIRIYQYWGVRWQNMDGLKRVLLVSFDKIAILLSTQVIVVSRSVKEFLLASFNSSNLFVIGDGSTSGVSRDIFFPQFDDFQTRNDKTFLKVGYAGRIANDKGISSLYKIFTQLQNRFPQIMLEIVGDSDLSDSISDGLSLRLRSHENIFWYSNKNQKDLAHLMRSWTCQIFLSEREGLGNVILEAGTLGVPTFCWDIMGTRDAVPDFARRFLIPYGDFDMLENEISSYLFNPYDNVQRLALSSWYSEHFDQAQVLTNFGFFVEAIVKMKVGDEN